MKKSDTVNCVYCRRPIRYDGKIRHENESCFIKKSFGLTFEEIVKLIEHKCSNNDDLEEQIKLLKNQINENQNQNHDLNNQISELKLKNEELNQLLKNFYFKELSNTKFEVSPENPMNNIYFANGYIQNIILNFNVCLSTKKEYISAWNCFDKWCQRNNINALQSSAANNYISERLASNATATVNKNRSIIQCILKRLIPNFTINGIKINIEPKREKNTWDEDIFDDYLSWTEKNQPDLLAPQILQAKMGLRINSVANLKRDQIHFGDDGNRIDIYDSKTIKLGPLIKEVDEDVVKITKELIKNNENSDFLVDCGKSAKDQYQRAKYLGKKVNRCLKQYSDETGVPKATSHMMRRICVNNVVTEELGTHIMKTASEKLGHTNIKNTSKFYLNKEIVKERIVRTCVHEDLKQRSRIRLMKSAQFNFCEMKDEKLCKKQKNSLNEALNYYNIEFSDDLSFPIQNNENIKSMRLADIKVFKKFKEQSRNGLYAPLKLVFDDVEKWTVKATTMIPRYCFIAEYSGEVVDRQNDEITNSNAIMEFHTTENSELVIYPDRFGNIARFISGINNKIKGGKKKINVKSAKFNIEGSIHIILYTCRMVHSGETLYYDYNAGGLNEIDTSGYS